MHIQDFEFDAALQSGVSQKKNNILFKGLFKLEKYLLNVSDVASTISLSMLNKLKTKTKSDTYYFPNWVNQNDTSFTAFERHKYLKSNKFKILYSGNIGDKQNWEFFIEFLNALKNYKNVEVCIVGDGVKKEWLISKVINLDYVNVYNPVPLKQLNNLLFSADLHILFQKEDVLDTVMPSKILGMMASGVPSLITGNCQSEVAQIIKQSEGGVYLPNNLSEVLKSFLKLQSDKNYRKTLGANARNFVIKNFEYNSILPKFETALKNLLKIAD